MAKLIYTCFSPNRPQGDELEFTGDISAFIRSMQNVNLKSNKVCFKWRLDYGLCDYHKQKQLNAELNSGPVFLAIWTRDCDLMESYQAYKFANMHEANKAVHSEYENAEGPVEVSYITEEDFNEFNGYTFDRAAEQAGY